MQITEKDFEKIKAGVRKNKVFPIRIISDSMEPIIMTGEEAICETITAQDLNLFDLLVFWDHDKLVCHQVLKPVSKFKSAGVEVVLTSSYKYLQTDFPVPFKNILGRVVSHKLTPIQKITFALKFRFKKRKH